ncbi:MAG: N-acetylmuramoyl-L-alanine amidase [Oscillospiraceae bacterium]|nr:N-acetylmuramoyl-L-alanine amidase [Oscillospiraceae bacterium]
MKKVFIGVGHGGTDSGAVKYIVEKEYTLKTAKAVAEYLEEYGIGYKLSRTADIDTDMDSKVKMCNDYKPDLVIDVHFNAGGGTGFEVYYSVVGGVSKTLADNINTEVKKILSSRGVKTRTLDSGADYFAIIRETDAPAVLLEGGFVDTQSDADFIKANYKKLAKAYADGIAKTLGVSKPKTLPVLDKSGYKKGDNTIGSYALKLLLLLAKQKNIQPYNMDENSYYFGDGTQNAVNYLLKIWGYAQNGIAGKNFEKRLYSELSKVVK